MKRVTNMSLPDFPAVGSNPFPGSGEKQPEFDLIDLQDEIDLTADLVECLSMACGDLDEPQRAALLSLVNVVSDKLMDIKKTVGTNRRSPNRGAANDPSFP